MANKPFDYTIINPYERPKSADLNQMQGQAHADVRLLARQLFKTPSASTGSEGFVNDSFKVVPFTGIFGFKFSQGIGFQNGDVNTSIGGISGLNDEYIYKPLTIEDREFAFPTGYECATGYHRYDLVQVRCLAPSGSLPSEQVENYQATDILTLPTPTTPTFIDLSKPKTLTFDLTNADIEIIPGSGTGSKPIVIKQGIPVPSGNPYRTAPTVDAGYLTVAILSITESTSALVSGDIIDQRVRLYSGVDFESSANTGTLPVIRGGTGRQTLTNKALLVGSGFGDVDFISPGTAGQVLTSDGTQWAAASPFAYTANAKTALEATYVLPNVDSLSPPPPVELSDLSLIGYEFGGGVMRISVQPTSDGNPSRMYIYRTSPMIGSDSIAYFLKLVISGVTDSGPVSYSFNYWHDADISTVYWEPAINVVRVMPKGTYDLKFYGSYTATSNYTINAYMKNITLYASQG